MRLVVLLALAGCGRISFEPHALGGAVDGQGPSDVGVDASDPDLLFHVPFDNGFEDVVGGHTTFCANTCPLLTAGHVGAGSGLFNGTPCLGVDDSADLHPATFTFALWAALSIPGQNSDLFARPLNGNITSTDTFEMWAQPDSAIILAANGVQSNTTGLDITLWHHYAGVFDGTTLITYVDGAPFDTRPAGTTSYGPDPYLIGCDLDGGAYVSVVSGNLDNVRFYGRPLSTAEIAAIAADHI